MKSEPNRHTPVIVSKITDLTDGWTDAGRRRNSIPYHDQLVVYSKQLVVMQKQPKLGPQGQVLSVYMHRLLLTVKCLMLF